MVAHSHNVSALTVLSHPLSFSQGRIKQVTWGVSEKPMLVNELIKFNNSIDVVSKSDFCRAKPPKQHVLRMPQLLYVCFL